MIPLAKEKVTGMESMDIDVKVIEKGRKKEEKQLLRAQTILIIRTDLVCWIFVESYLRKFL